ncbi:DUF6508 domain-containing protein [Anaerosacchariphilus polymeriproducens]|uniref:Uncharacterized protein n=1 Tax=Anaerosacchariphilus polymeriproducens TaxID=1812858 RepID=A0A371AT06_9FIRM|nr:DUF6508 domain-containing protein [Anaerosacchariphilus polymeriproducens]RDU22695.1 hypothetical protein DWV06_13050 [Anaerosacchariphilus polymeriproducens]
MDKKEQKIPSEIIAEYKNDIDLLIAYIPWLETKSGNDVMSTYKGDSKVPINFSIPIYDGTLMRFIKLIQTTKFMDKNYPYFYRRHNVKTSEDEIKAIKKATINDIEVFRGIFSKYVIMGRSHGTVWQQGVANGVFLALLIRLKEIIEYYDKTLLEKK